MNFFPFDVHLDFNRDKTRTMVRLWKRKRCWESTIQHIIRCLPYAAHLAGGSEHCSESEPGWQPGCPRLTPAPATATAETGLTAEDQAQPGPGKGSLLPAASPLLLVAMTLQVYIAGSVPVRGNLPEGLREQCPASPCGTVWAGCILAPSLHINIPHQHLPYPTSASSAGRWKFEETHSEARGCFWHRVALQHKYQPLPKLPVQRALAGF